jgi:DNA-binding NarL/FixJ family response regulator
VKGHATIERQPGAQANGLAHVALVGDARVLARLEAVLAGAGVAVARIAGSPEQLEEAGPGFDTVIVAEDMGDVRTAAVLRRLREHSGAPRVIIIRSRVDGHVVRRALEAGASGMVDVADAERALVPTLRAIAVGQIVVPEALRRQAVPAALSHRERQVLALVVEGCTNGEIAQQLFLAESTVKSHLATAFSKLGVRSRRDATAMILSGALSEAGVPAPADRVERRGRFAADSH